MAQNELNFEKLVTLKKLPLLVAQPIGIKQIFRSIIWLILITQKSNVG